MSTQAALKLLFELRAVLDRLGEDDTTLREAVIHDVDRAVRLTNDCIAALTQGAPAAAADAEAEHEEEDEE